MDYTGGLDEEIRDVQEQENVILAPKRRPFHYWKVGEKEYKLKLTTRMIERVETKYGKNILNLVDEIPPLSVMLTITQAAMTPWEHGISYSDIQKLYDSWTDQGGNQMEFFTKIVMPTLVVSGVFTDNQAASIMENLKDVDQIT